VCPEPGDSEHIHYYEPRSGHRLAHDPFNSIVAPRPIGWISTVDRAGRANLAPYSFFNAFNYHPPIIGFASIGWKDTISNVSATGEFVWNLTTRDLAPRMNITSTTVEAEVNEFELAGLTQAPSRLIKPARVRESPVNLECRRSQVIQLTSAEGSPVRTWLVLGEVVAVHIARWLIEGGVYQTARAHPVLRSGGVGDYATISPETMFTMMRPNPPRREG
jgi:flavin reductase (DIM6/NTAB) family NADH-FMN oxidoreductase RutF